MAPDDEKFHTLVDAAVARAIETYRDQEPRSCALNIDEETHVQEHEFIRGLMKVACKLEKIKWGFLGSMVKTIGGGLIALLVIGALYAVKKHMGSM